MDYFIKLIDIVQIIAFFMFFLLLIAILFWPNNFEKLIKAWFIDVFILLSIYFPYAIFVVLFVWTVILVTIHLKKEALPKVLIAILAISIFIILFLIVPHVLLGIFIIWAVISLIIFVKNGCVLKRYNTKEIYIRDINVDYSPAVLSYLMNHKIEIKKDLSATLLNLCAKKILKIKKLKDGKFKIIDLKNKEAISKLMPDEAYAYEMLTSNITNSKINYWKSKVKKEYKKYKFSKEQKKILIEYFTDYFLHFYIFIVVAIAIISPFSTLLAKILGITLLALPVSIPVVALFSLLRAIFLGNGESEFRENYTRKGAKERNRWKKFEKFMEDFTLIDDKNPESIIIWGKYLSYSIVLGINKKCDSELYNKIKKEYLFDYDVILEMLEEDEK